MEHDRQQCRIPGGDNRESKRGSPWFQSNWITRLMNRTGEGEARSDPEFTSSGESIRRSFSCSSLPETPRRFFRQDDLCDDQDAEEGDSLVRFLSSGKQYSNSSTSNLWLGQLEGGSSNRPLCVSLDRGAFVCRGSHSSSSSMRSVPSTIIRGFEGMDGEKLNLFRGPLPYSSFEDQKTGRRVQSTEENKDTRDHLVGQISASLLHPILADDTAADASEYTTTADKDEDQLEEHVRPINPRSEQFVHQESVLKSDYNKQQELLPRGTISSEWLTRWSTNNEDNSGGPSGSSSSNENVLRLRSAHVPSAQAMAIMGNSKSRSVSLSDTDSTRS